VTTFSSTSLPRVLVVDDDPQVGTAIRRVLHGFQVTFAQSSAGALGRIQAGGEFQAVVCDVRMPGMSGLQLHTELVRLAPEMARRLVFVTGAATPEVEDYVRDAQVRLVPKPFTPTELRAVVTAACHTPPLAA
jgi:CheY-like chemotaxis protein